jgi:hypothetical protein
MGFVALRFQATALMQNCWGFEDLHFETLYIAGALPPDMQTG